MAPCTNITAAGVRLIKVVALLSQLLLRACRMCRQGADLADRLHKAMEGGDLFVGVKVCDGALREPTRAALARCAPCANLCGWDGTTPLVTETLTMRFTRRGRVTTASGGCSAR